MEGKTPINLFEEIRKLNFPAGEYIIVGSGIMSAKGIRPAYDLDIIVTPELFDTCWNNGWELMPWTREGKKGKPWLKKDNTDLALELGFDEEALSAKDLMRDGEIIEGIYFMNLRQLIVFKKEYGRKKDFDDIALIEEYLRKTTT